MPYILDAYIKESLEVITALSGTLIYFFGAIKTLRPYRLHVVKMYGLRKCNATWRMQYKLSMPAAMLCVVECYAMRCECNSGIVKTRPTFLTSRKVAELDLIKLRETIPILGYVVTASSRIHEMALLAGSWHPLLLETR